MQIVNNENQMGDGQNVSIDEKQIMLTALIDAIYRNPSLEQRKALSKVYTLIRVNFPVLKKGDVLLKGSTKDRFEVIDIDFEEGGLMGKIRYSLISTVDNFYQPQKIWESELYDLHPKYVLEKKA